MSTRTTPTPPTPLAFLLGDQHLKTQCANCKKSIRGRVLKALGKNWHTECFTCSQCSCAIETSSFALFNGQPWCEKCLKGHEESSMRSVSPCDRCGNPIDGLVVSFGGKSWCSTCVACSSCELALKPGHGFVDATSGAIICDDCATKRHENRSLCFECGVPIASKFIKADKNIYHRDCLKCNDCSQNIRGGYAKVDGRILCGECAMQSRKHSAIPQAISANRPQDVQVYPTSKPAECPKCSTKTCEEGVFCGECGHRLINATS